MAIRETRYIDLDYRSEYSAYYSRAFKHYPASATRLHFFTAPVPATYSFGDRLSNDDYVGYMILRPTAAGPVGRTMLRPPPNMTNAITTTVTDEINLFGQTLQVSAAPFVQQDTQLGKCAHAAAWVCHYAAHRRGWVGRQTIASFATADLSPGAGGAVPSGGLTPEELADVLRSFELPPFYYSINSLPPATQPPLGPKLPTSDPQKKGRHPGSWDQRIMSICCRYLNSGLPVLIGTQDHAFVLCGYTRVPGAEARDRIRFIRQDDQAGPYVDIRDIFHDRSADVAYSPWHSILVPVPEKVWVRGEEAERTGHRVLKGWASIAAAEGGSAFTKALRGDDVSYRTYVISSNEFKQGAESRLDPVVALAYRLARMPRFVWVVEAVLRSRREAGAADCVVGEAIIDATSGPRPDALAVHVAGAAVLFKTPGPGAFDPIWCGRDPYPSGAVGPG